MLNGFTHLQKASHSTLDKNSHTPESCRSHPLQPFAAHTVLSNLNALQLVFTKTTTNESHYYFVGGGGV